MAATLKYLIIGAGATGWSVACHLHRHAIPFRVVDSRTNPPYEEQFRSAMSSQDICFGNFAPAWFEESEVLVISPGVSTDIEEIRRARMAGKKIVSDIELFARSSTKPYIAITGSNGKSTVTAMVERVLNDCGMTALAGGNFGTPALDMLAKANCERFVLELSSFQLESTTSLQAEVSVLLNVTDDHLDRHGTYVRYRDIKKSICKGARYCVVYRGQADLLDQLDHVHPVTFGSDEPAAGHFGLHLEHGVLWLVKGSQRLMRADCMQIAGQHNLLNALATFAVADCLQLEHEQVARSLSAFQSLPYRCECIAEHQGVCWFNDSKGTNLGATQAAIEGLPDRQILICGGIFKGGALDSFKRIVMQKVDCVIAFGRDRQVFVDLLQDVVTTHVVDSLEAAIELAGDLSVSKQAILFSPACASFDMFENYIHRGQEFNRLVQELILRERACQPA